MCRECSKGSHIELGGYRPVSLVGTRSSIAIEKVFGNVTVACATVRTAPSETSNRKFQERFVIVHFPLNRSVSITSERKPTPTRMLIPGL